MVNNTYNNVWSWIILVRMWWKCLCLVYMQNKKGLKTATIWKTFFVATEQTGTKCCLQLLYQQSVNHDRPYNILLYFSFWLKVLETCQSVLIFNMFAMLVNVTFKCPSQKHACLIKYVLSYRPSNIAANYNLENWWSVILEIYFSDQWYYKQLFVLP